MKLSETKNDFSITKHYQTSDMKITKNIFDSFKFLYYTNKFCGYLFFTIIKDDSGKYYSTTTFYNVIFFMLNIILSVIAVIATLKFPIEFSSRSIIINLGVFINQRTVILRPLAIILINFWKRNDMFKIILNMHLIDEKVIF